MACPSISGEYSQLPSLLGIRVYSEYMERVDRIGSLAESIRQRKCQCTEPPNPYFEEAADASKHAFLGSGEPGAKSATLDLGSLSPGHVGDAPDLLALRVTTSGRRAKMARVSQELATQL